MEEKSNVDETLLLALKFELFLKLVTTSFFIVFQTISAAGL